MASWTAFEPDATSAMSNGNHPVRLAFGGPILRMKGNLSSNDRNLASLLIDLSERERVDLKNISEKKPFNISFDVINWKLNKFK